MATDHRNTPIDEALLGLERAKCLADDAFTALFFMLHRELDAIDKLVMDNPQRSETTGSLREQAARVVRLFDDEPMATRKFEDAILKLSLALGLEPLPRPERVNPPEKATTSAPARDDDEPEVESDDYLLLRGCDLVDAVYAVRAIAASINEHGKGDDRVVGLAGALALVGEKLEDALGTVDSEFELAVAKYLTSFNAVPVPERAS
jgi:hypothetical protein